MHISLCENSYELCNDAMICVKLMESTVLYTATMKGGKRLLRKRHTHLSSKENH